MKILGEPYDDAIECPQCGFDYCHTGRVTIKNEDSPSRPSDQGRGSRIIIRMMCEQNHQFELHLQFHKGKTYIWTVAIPSESELSELSWGWLE